MEKGEKMNIDNEEEVTVVNGRRPAWVYKNMRDNDYPEYLARKQVWRPDMTETEFWIALEEYKENTNKGET